MHTVRHIFFLSCLLSLFFLHSSTAEAKPLITASDTLSTTRPSASSDIAVGAAASASQIVITDNDSILLASDSAQLQSSSGTILATSAIAYSSAEDTPATNQRTVYLTTPLGTSATTADNLIVPVKAVHTIQFTTQTSLPSGGSIVITFPGSGNNNAYPGSNEFAFNSLSSSDIQYYNATCSTLTISSPTITCDVSTTIAAGTTITILIGCTASSGTVCTTKKPTLINPFKTTTGGDILKVKVATLSTTDSELDASYLTVATGTSTLVLATVESRFTFTLGGVSTSTAVNDSNPACTLAETTNAAANAQAKYLDLGQLKYTPSTKETKLSNITAQLLGVSTNAQSGYVLYASSNAPLAHERGSSSISTSASPDTPESFPSGKNFFGIHACGTDADTAIWTEAGDQNCQTVIAGSTANECKYSWPQSGDDIILATDYTGPIGSGQTSGSGLTSISYAAGIDATTPAGNYKTSITYTALPTF